jgi:hypothetical protein
MRSMAQKNDRVELEMKIVKYRSLARQAADDETTQRIKALIAELEQKTARDRRVRRLKVPQIGYWQRCRAPP